MENYLTVSAVTKYIKRKLDMDSHLKGVLIRGEISNFKHHNRGHMYLTIKDDQARIQAVMFKGDNSRLRFVPEDGMNVLIEGDISVFERFGQYQLYIQRMEPGGIGALYVAFEQLKKKLQTLGMFNDEHKKPIPLFPKHIGIITSPTGAAVRDIITTINRRYPLAETTILPTIVQGDHAKTSIAGAIKHANQLHLFDVLIVGRGGGSIEDLWAFNEEEVAYAIYESNIPIISAVGHETDTTISDFIADKRAPTPTGAAEISVPSVDELIKRIHVMDRTMKRSIDIKVKNAQDMLKRFEQSYAFRYPKQLISQKEQELDTHVERLEKTILSYIKQQQQNYIQFHERLLNQHPLTDINRSEKELNRLTRLLSSFMQNIYSEECSRLQNIIDKLALLNPLEIMRRGYAIPYQKDGSIIHSTTQVNEDEQIRVTLSDGTLKCQVLQKKEGKMDE